MEIREFGIDEIKPYEKNPRKNENSVKFVVNSIKEFGFKVPIVIDADNVIVAGHTRWKAALRTTSWTTASNPRFSNSTGRNATGSTQR